MEKNELHNAAVQDDVKAPVTLEEEIELSKSVAPDTGYTLLHIAILNEDKPLFDSLMVVIEGDVPLNCKDYKGRTALHLCCRDYWGPERAMADYFACALVQKDICTHAPCLPLTDGETFLELAVRKTDRNGVSPVWRCIKHLASSQQNCDTESIEILTALLCSGADLSTPEAERYDAFEQMEKGTWPIISKQRMAHEEVRHNEQIFFDCSDEIEKYKCEICSNFEVNSWAALKSHIKNGHKDESLEEDVYKCTKCFFTTYSRYLLRWHGLLVECPTRRENERWKTGPETTQTLKSGRFLTNLEAKPKQWLQCEQCPFRSKTKRVQQTHIITHHTKPEDIQWYDCPDCPYRGKQSANLKQHIKLRHCKLEDIQWLECEQCPSKFNRKDSLKKHIIARHSKPEDIQWFQCEQCTARFKSKSHLKDHVICRHSMPEDIQWFECDQCPARFKKRTHWRRHVLDLHARPEDIPWYHCPHCAYKCKRSGNLRPHIKLRHTRPEDIQWFECEQCPSKFKMKCTLNEHVIALHTASKDMQLFLCDQCSSKFKTKRVLLGHITARHTKPEDIKWYRCAQCSFKAKQSGNLQIHVRSRHTRPEDVQWFECERCPAKFEKKFCLQRHVAARHTKPEDVEWFACPHCSYKCKQSGNLKRHVKARHGNS